MERVLSNEKQSSAVSFVNENTARKNVFFSIGSPGVISSTPSSHGESVIRKFSAVDDIEPSVYDCSLLADMISNGIIETSSTMFTPKRSVIIIFVIFFKLIMFRFLVYNLGDIVDLIKSIMKRI